MTEQQLRDMILRVMAELDSAQKPPEQPRTAILVLFSGALLGFEDALASLSRLLQHQVSLDYTLTDSASRILDQDAITSIGMTPAAQSLVTSHDVLVVPTLTVNLAAKVAHGIGDCLASNVVAEFIMSNKPVVVATTAACPDSAEKKGWFPNMPVGYQAMLRANLATLRSFGVHMSSAANLDRAVLRVIGQTSGGGQMTCPEKVISEDIVRGLAPGSTVRIMPGAVVTALARDTAASLSIVLVRS